MIDGLILDEIKAFNRNVEWLKKNKNSTQSIQNAPEWIDLSKALEILDRSRTWLDCHRITPEDVAGATIPHPLKWYLIRGIDWEKEGRNLIFKLDSIIRLKNELINMGIAYDQSRKN